MNPGIHPNIPFADYCKLPAMNAGTLLWGQCSMAHVKAAIDGKIQIDSPDLAFGRAFHCRVLEPEEYGTRYMVSGECEAVIASGDRKGDVCGSPGKYLKDGQWVCGAHGKGGHKPAVEVVTREDHERIEGMFASLKAHPIINHLRRRGGAETTVIGELDGVLCKVRFDKLITDEPVVAIDLKKCQLGAASRSKVQKSIVNWSYHARAAFYLDVLEAAGGPAAKDAVYVLAFVEEEYPFAVSVPRLIEGDNEWLDIGRADYRRLLAAYKACMASGVWPGYTDDAGMIDVWTSHPPAWLVDRHMNRPLESPGVPASDDDVMW